MTSLPNFLIIGLLLVTHPVLAQTDEELDLVLFDPILLSETGQFDVGGRITAYPAYQGLASLTRDIPGQDAAEDPVVPDQAQVASYMARITLLEQEEGVFSPGLIQNLLALGSLHQQRQEHEQAIAIFERADHISRINYGLYDAGQIPIVEGMVESFLALGDYRSVSDRQRYLYFLNQKLRPTGTIPTLPSLTDMADNSMSILDQALTLTNDYSQGARFRFGGSDGPGVAEIARYYTLNSLFRAKSNYAAAIASLIRNDNLEHPRLMELEYKHLETLFLLGFRQELIGNPHYYMTSAKITANQANRWTFLKRNLSGYETGVESYGRMLRYLEMDSETQAEELVRTHLEFGDWHLLFGWGDAAAAEYEQAYARAMELELSEEQVDSLFRPDFPRQLPLFSAKPNSREKFGIPLDKPLEYDGYIDIRFRINKNGTARDLRFLGSSPGTRAPTQVRLKRYLKNSPFRPFLVDGKGVNHTVEMRYYYTFQ